MGSGYRDPGLTDDGAVEAVARKLSAFAALERGDLDLLQSLRIVERFGAGRTMRVVGDARPRLRFITSGWAARQRLLADGRRQILSVLLPGDLIGLSDYDSAWAGTSVVALTPVETVDAVSVFDAEGLVRGSAGLQAAIAGTEALEQWLAVEQIVRLGRRTALERSAHFLLELEFRLGLAGLCERARFPMPITQEVLSDVLGLSVVHVNRTFLQLRRDRWIDLRSRVVQIVKYDDVAAAGEFQPPVKLGLGADGGAARPPLASAAY